MPTLFLSSSLANFSQDEIGEPILDVILESGDLLYFPRGTIHQVGCGISHVNHCLFSSSEVSCCHSLFPLQASTLPDAHSLHMTVSTCQMNTWGDLLEKVRDNGYPHSLAFPLTPPPLCLPRWTEGGRGP